MDILPFFVLSIMLDHLQERSSIWILPTSFHSQNMQRELYWQNVTLDPFEFLVLWMFVGSPLFDWLDPCGII